jgi:predicted permease
MRFWNRFRFRLRTRGAQQFGDASAAADQSRDEWSFRSFDALWMDLKFAMRLMLRQPLLTAAAVLTVAFGVGANTAILSVLETVLLNPLGMSRTGNVMVGRVHINKLKMFHSNTSAVEFRELQAMTDIFSAAAAMEGRSWTYQAGGQAVRLLGRAVTPEFFQVFGAAPALGRFFTDDDRHSLVLSHGMWVSQFGADPQVLGRAVVLDDTPYRVVGVAREDFRFPAGASAWAPLTLENDRMRRGYNMSLLVFGRRRPGVSARQAQDRVNRYLAGTMAAPGGGDLGKMGYGVDLDSFAVYLAGDLRNPLWMLWAAALVVLLTGCANVAGLLLTRSAGRKKEMAIRLSVGGTRWQIVRQLLLESLLLGVTGGLAGLAAAAGAMRFITRVPLPGKPMLELVSLNGRMLSYGLGLAILSSLVFGLAPAVQLLRESQASAMARSRRKWFQDVFVTAEVAGAFLLVMMTGLLLRSLWNVQKVETGFDQRNLSTAYFTKPKNDPGFQNRLETALQNAPGVESAALVYPVPFTTGGLTSGFAIRNRQPLPGGPEWHGEAYFITPQYLRTMRIALLKGRNLADTDDAKSQRVCLIDRKLAERFFLAEDPMGQQIAMYGGWAQIVGVVANIRADGLEEDARPVVYYPAAQIAFFSQSAAVVRSSVPGGQIIREAAARTNASVPVFDIRTMEERIGDSMGIRRVLAALLAVFGSISLLLAAIGIYGVIAQVVGERTQEVGIRMALGARPYEILGHFMRQGLLAGGLGLLVGLAATAAVQKWVGTLLYQIHVFDLSTLATATAGIVAVLLLAVWLPSRRASRIDPQTALRHE